MLCWYSHHYTVMELIRSQHMPRATKSQPFNVFHSFFSLNDEPIYRSILNDEHLSSQIVLPNGNRFTGEDPRLFVLNGRRYVLTQRFITDMKTVEQYVVDVESGSATQYLVSEPDFFYGKNWTPFVYNDKLWIIHCFDPFTLLCDGKVVVQMPLYGLDKSFYDNFTAYRGGTNGMEVRPGVFVGVGHQTVDKRTHKPFRWELDFNTMTVDISDMDIPSQNSLCDPTSIFIDETDSRMYVSFYEGNAVWNVIPHDYYLNIYRLPADFATKVPSEQNVARISISLINE